MPLLSEDNRRKRNLLVIAGFLLLVGAANLVDIGVYAPDLPLASNITIFALLNLNLIVLLLLVLLLFRNLVKLWFERRQQVIGARFKAKLVLSFMALAVPTSSRKAPMITRLRLRRFSSLSRGTTAPAGSCGSRTGARSAPPCPPAG